MVLDTPECICPCGTCIDAIGYDPEIPCPDCPAHGQPEPELSD